MSYKLIPSIPEGFEERSGLEGPFNFNGRPLYYDAHEGLYYDPRTDFYVSHNEFEELCR